MIDGFLLLPMIEALAVYLVYALLQPEKF